MPTSESEVRACCYKAPHPEYCAVIPCSILIPNNQPCFEARAVGADLCGLYRIEDCHECFTDDHCRAFEGTRCSDQGVCKLPGRTPTPTIFSPCQCDCDGSGQVTVNELVLAVGITLGERQVSSCPSADMNASGAVEINELVAAVGMALQGCAL